MNETYDLHTGETHIEVHKFFPGAILVVTIAALVLQSSVPVYLPNLNIIELPLLVTIYF